MRSNLDVWTDPDLAEMMKTDPGLVAIADVVVQAAPAGRPQTRRRLRASHAAVAVALLLIAAVPAVAFSRDLQRRLGFISNPPVARNWVQATLISPIPKSAPAGSTVTVRWKLWSLDQHGKVAPFGAADLFARIVNPARTRVTRADARCHDGRKAIYCHDGHFYARIRVPSGGIGKIQVGIMGWSDGPGGRSKPAPGLFPITNYP
jgi:hypothetical protein